MVGSDAGPGIVRLRQRLLEGSGAAKVLPQTSFSSHRGPDGISGRSDPRKKPAPSSALPAGFPRSLRVR
eukprot:13965428-Alexandrium_andersonii.AAC.1